MAYGTIKVDNIIFTNGGSDQTVTVSGIVASTSGNLTVTGTISGGTVKGTYGSFTSLTGVTTSGTNANFQTITGAVGVYTTSISGLAITGNTAGFTTVTGTTVTGTTANFVTLSGTTITGGTINVTTTNITSGIFAAGSAAAPSIAFTGDTDTGIYSPGANQVAISTNGTGRLYIDASGNVGVGVLSPVSQLHIQKATDGLAGIQISTSAYGTTSADGLFVGIDNDTAYVYNYENKPLQFATNNTERMRITGAGLVGVGTSTPGAKLAVNGDILSNDRGTSFGYKLPDCRIFNPSSGGIFAIDDYTTTRFFINSSGNVGIGTSAPATLLQLNSAAATNTTLGYSENGTLKWYNRYNAGDGSFQIVDVVNTTTRLHVSNTGNVGIGTTSPAQQLHVKTDQAAYTWARIDNQSSSASAYAGLMLGAFGNSWGMAIGSSAANSNALTFVIDAGGSNSEKMRLDSSGLLGLGTSNPQQELHINDATGVSRIRLSGGAANADNFDIGQSIPGVSNSGFSIYDVDATASRLVIDSSGNVGIGTTSPNTALEVNGTIRSGTGSGASLSVGSIDVGKDIGLADGQGIVLGSARRIAIGSTGTTTLNAATATAPFIANIGASEVTRIDSSGRLLVGTSSSSSNSSIVCQANSGSTLGGGVLRLCNGQAVPGDGEDLGYVMFGDSGHTAAAEVKASRDGGTWSGSSKPTRLVFSTTADGSASPTERMRITSAGLVGIGTSSPGATCEIYSSSSQRVRVGEAPLYTPADFATLGGSITLSRASDNRTDINAIYGYDTTTSASNNLAITARNQIVFIANLSEKMRLDDAGRLGIGTTAPGSRLEVGGESAPRIGINSTGAGTAGVLFQGTGTTYGSIIENITTGELAIKAGASGQNSYFITFGTNDGTERARIDPSGRLLVGTSSSFNGGLLCIGSGQGSNSPSGEHIKIAPSANRIEFLDSNSNASDTGSVSLYNTVYNNRSANIKLFHPTSNTGGIAFETHDGTSLTEAMRITSSQDLMISQSGSGIFVGTIVDGAFRIGRSSFAVSTGTLYIGNAAIQVSSDVRLKENIEDTSLDALDVISKVKVKDFTWKDPSDTSHNNRNARGKWTGLIAQELVEVLPFVVNAPRKEEDGLIDHDSESIWTLDQSQLCPVLIKAIQQQQAIIASLEARLTAAGIA